MGDDSTANSLPNVHVLMAEIASTKFLDHLKAIFPQRTALQGPKAVLGNPWYIVALVGYASSNRPEAVPIVFQHVLVDLRKAQNEAKLDEATAHDEQLLLARRCRECILKGGVLGGASRAINSLVALHAVMPDDLKDTKTMRDTSVTTEEYVKRGEQLFRAMYRETADNVQGLLDEIYPDMGWFSKVIGYGMTYGQTDLFTQVEVSYILVASLIAMDTPRQIGWHLTNAQHGGATAEETNAIRRISMEVAEVSGIKWRDGVPEV